MIPSYDNPHVSCVGTQHLPDTNDIDNPSIVIDQTTVDIARIDSRDSSDTTNEDAILLYKLKQNYTDRTRLANEIHIRN